MGLFYSITSYFKPHSHKESLTQAKITSKSRRLIHYINLRKIKLQQQTKKIEHSLVQMVMQPAGSRSRQAQRCLINTVVMNSQKLLAYDQVIHCLHHIINQGQTLEVAPSSISNQCVIAICSVIFVDQQMGLHNDVSLDQFIPKPRPAIGMDKISEKLQKYLKRGAVSDYQANTYALEMGARNNIALERINEGGHAFEFNPHEVEKQSASAIMFAMSLQDFAAEEPVLQ